MNENLVVVWPSNCDSCKDSSGKWSSVTLNIFKSLLTLHVIQCIYKDIKFKNAAE